MDKEKVSTLRDLLERKDWAEDVLAEMRSVVENPTYALHQFVEVRVPVVWVHDLVVRAERELASINGMIESL